jgi:hypothetical protein
MQPISPRGNRPAKQVMRRLNRAMGEINPFLLATALGLAILYLTCLGALLLKLPVTRLNACPANATVPATTRTEPR